MRSVVKLGTLLVRLRSVGAPSTHVRVDLLRLREVGGGAAEPVGELALTPGEWRALTALADLRDVVKLIVSDRGKLGAAANEAYNAGLISAADRDDVHTSANDEGIGLLRRTFQRLWP